MRFQNVFLESIGVSLPDEVVTTAQIEQQLQPLYQRLRLPEGRLELITGVAERRFWAPETLPSSQSIKSANRAIEAAGFDRSKIGCLIHASVCRDHLEPATACAVHHGLGLPTDCQIFDLSNACLGLMNGLLLLGTMIDAGQIEAGIVVGTEGSRQLVETTIQELNTNQTFNRKTLKATIASLTIGSGSCALLLTSEQATQSGTRLLGGTAYANTQFHDLCHNGADQAVASGMQPLMETDSERLMQEGCTTGAENFRRFLDELAWTRESIQKTICHQVGPAHKKLMFESLLMDRTKDYSTVEWLGNTGSVALPITMAAATRAGHLEAGDKVAMLGIGSGINCLMLGAQWQNTRIEAGDDWPETVLDHLAEAAPRQAQS